uniref:Uncharacterized protein n=1 Tax=Molossus molossus TaxID=27622 RepID=A0A7J8DBX4_MOLMO|nr:hypothetical protein HJG59_009312 [Molossus molossus]
MEPAPQARALTGNRTGASVQGTTLHPRRHTGWACFVLKVHWPPALLRVKTRGQLSSGTLAQAEVPHSPCSYNFILASSDLNRPCPGDFFLDLLCALTPPSARTEPKSSLRHFSADSSPTPAGRRTPNARGHSPAWHSAEHTVDSVRCCLNETMSSLTRVLRRVSHEAQRG